MTEHRRATILAATAIDFELTGNERAELDAHLELCAACRAAAANLRRQAGALGGRPRATPPAHMRRYLESKFVARRPRRSSSNGLRLALTGIVAIVAVIAIAFSVPRLAVYLGQVGASPTRAPVQTSEVGRVKSYVGLAGSHSITSTSSHCHVLPVSDCVTDVQAALGSIWVTTSDSILRFDPTSETVVANIPVGSFPHRIWYADGSMWTTVVDPGALVRMDPASNTVLTTIPVGGSPVGIVDGGGSIWVVDAAGDRVVRVNPATNTIIGTTPVAVHPWGITATDGAIWVSDIEARALVRIDSGSGTVVATVDIAPGESDTTGSDAVSGFGRIWLMGHNAIYSYNIASGEVESLLTQTYPRMAIGPNAVWVVGSINTIIQEFAPTSLTQIGQTILYPSNGQSAGFELSIDAALDGVLWAATDEGNRLLRVTPTR